MINAAFFSQAQEDVRQNLQKSLPIKIRKLNRRPIER
jgi:hypothetical protein